MTRIFLTGATGYIGGEALYRLASLGSQYQISCLVRGNKAPLVSSAYPGVRVVPGDLDDVKLVEQGAREADIVLHLANTKHVASSEAIAKGLSSPGRSPGYWIQMSGASLFVGEEIKSGKYGEAGGRVYDDIEGVEEIRSVIQQSPGRVVDNLVLSQNTSSVKTALLVGPLIYGLGRGPGNIRSIQAPDAAKYTLKEGKGFTLGAGESIWSNIHIQDLSALVCLLVEAAAKGETGIWNDNGIYLPENGSMPFGKLTSLIAEEAHKQGLIENPSADFVVDPADADNVTPHGAILLGTNAKLVGTRAKKFLGWSPSSPSLEDEVAELVKYEALALSKHATP